MQRIYGVIAAFIFVFFGLFTVAGVFGFLPSDLQDAVNPDPLRIFPVANADAVSSTTPAGASGASAVGDAAPLTGLAALGIGAPVVKQMPPIVYTPTGMQEYPTHVTIASVGIDAPVINPESLSADVLDQALLSGAVRYPLSGVLNAGKDIFIFGHSTGFKVVHNKAYQTFSHLMDVKVGDEVRLDGEESFSLYRVTSVTILKDSDAVVSIGGDGKTLTISTCDTFAAKEDRVVVQSTLIGNFSKSVVGYE